MTNFSTWDPSIHIRVGSTSDGVDAQRYVSTGKGSDNAVLISSTASSSASTPSLTRWSISFVNSSVCSYSANVAMVACSVGELAFLLTSRASAPAATTDSAARAARAARVCAGRILTNSSPLRSRLLACIDECRYTVDPIDLRTCFAESRLQTVRWMIVRCALRIHALRQPRHIPWHHDAPAFTKAAGPLGGQTKLSELFSDKHMCVQRRSQFRSSKTTRFHISSEP